VKSGKRHFCAPGFARSWEIAEGVAACSKKKVGRSPALGGGNTLRESVLGGSPGKAPIALGAVKEKVEIGTPGGDVCRSSRSSLLKASTSLSSCSDEIFAEDAEPHGASLLADPVFESEES
jgi:hypothetical protein